MADSLSGRRKRGSLTQAKAQEIEADHGFKRLGGGYDSQKQENYIHMVAHGGGGKKRRKRRGK